VASEPNCKTLTVAGLIRCLFYALVLGFWCTLAWAAPEPPASASPGAPEHKRVLILFGLGNNAPALHQVMSGFNAAVSDGNLVTDNVERELLDITPANHPEQARALRERLLNKYSGQHFDLIITVFNSALDFLENEGADLFPDTPAVAVLANKRAPLERAGQVLVQYPENSDMQGTLKRALELFPDTRRVVFVSGSTPDSRERERRARVDFRAWEDKLAFEYTSALPLSALLKHVANLPPQTIIIYSLITTDDQGKPLIPEVAALMLGRTANAPIFSHVSTMQGTGVIGGMMLDLQAYGNMLGHAVARFVRGQPMALEPSSAFIEPRFDWNQIQRWKADYQLLPGNSVFINRPVTLWTQYQREVTGALGVVLFLVLALVFLVLENQRRRKAELAALGSATALQVLKETTESDLREQVQQRTSELQNEILLRTQVERQAQEEQRQFIAMVSHEFRTPLAIISATTERLAGKPQALNDQTRSGFFKIQNSVARWWPAIGLAAVRSFASTCQLCLVGLNRLTQSQSERA
jgi:hypothetical protein